jgi:hypothetical protein
MYCTFLTKTSKSTEHANIPQAKEPVNRTACTDRDRSFGWKLRPPSQGAWNGAAIASCPYRRFLGANFRVRLPSSPFGKLAGPATSSGPERGEGERGHQPHPRFRSLWLMRGKSPLWYDREEVERDCTRLLMQSQCKDYASSSSAGKKAVSKRMP